MFPFAPSPDIYRAAEKDEALLTRLRDDVSDVCLQWGGQRWSARHAEVDLLSAAAFYGLTQLRGRPSLGEEYCDIRQVATRRLPASLPLPLPLSPAGGAVAAVDAWQARVALPPEDVAWPSAQRRVALFALQVLGPYAYARARRHQQQMGPLPPPTAGARPAARVVEAALAVWHRLLGWIPVVDAVWPHARRLHLALFFLTGRYLSLDKRLTGARYVALRTMDQQRPSYRGLGLLLLLQLAIVAAVKARQGWGAAVQWWTRPASALEAGEEIGAVVAAPGASIRYEDDAGDEEAGGRQCILHLGTIRDPTATECGHVSCSLSPSSSSLLPAALPLTSRLCPPSLLCAALSGVLLVLHHRVLQAEARVPLVPLAGDAGEPAPPRALQVTGFRRGLTLRR